MLAVWTQFHASREKLFTVRGRIFYQFVIIDFFFYFPFFTTSIYLTFCLRWNLDLPKFHFFPSTLFRFHLDATCVINCYLFRAVLYFFCNLPKVLLSQQTDGRGWRLQTVTYFLPLTLSFFLLCSISCLHYLLSVC